MYKLFVLQRPHLLPFQFSLLILPKVPVGFFKNEIIPVDINGIIVNTDEGPRAPDLDKIKSLDPAFDAEGSITAATSSPISVGAAAALIMGKEKSKELGISPKFKICSRAVAGVDWTRMGSGPLPATEKALKKAGMTMDDIETIELNEAFAAVVLRFMEKLDVEHEKINVNGGAIAMGHPLGATGAMILGTLLDEMERRELETGLATLCVGAGMGTATVIERV